MGAAVARDQHRSTRRQVPALKLVPAQRARSTSPRRNAAARAAASQRIFRVFASVVALVAILGIGRVWLSVQAAEASIAANELRSNIQTERYRGDMLEVRQSALGSPSRIRAIAGNAMQMTSSRKVTYLKLDTKVDSSVVSAKPQPSGSVAKQTVARLMDLTAGEAQVLLVGSIGLSRAK